MTVRILIKALNPIMILILIPVFNYLIYPLLAKCGILTTPLQKITTGMYTASLAFVVSGFLQVAIEDGVTRVPDYYGDTGVMIYNGNCDKLTVIQDGVWDNFTSDDALLGSAGDRTNTHDQILNLNDVRERNVINCH